MQIVLGFPESDPDSSGSDSDGSSDSEGEESESAADDPEVGAALFKLAGMDDACASICTLTYRCM